MIEICYSGYYDTNQFIQDNQEKINKCFQSIDEIFNIKDEKQMKAELFLQLNQLPNPTNDNYFIAKIMFKQCDDKVNFLQIEHDELGSYKEMYRVLTSSELS
ncbi:hypothetical protein FACS1894166_09970 [Bacilli bacterium]|nr:hypothetical protein FACS1894166_09970 [Bacilli bacterium]